MSASDRYYPLITVANCTLIARALPTVPPAGSSPLPSSCPGGEAGRAPGVEVERPAGRTTFAPGAWSAWLVLDVGRGDEPASTSTPNCLTLLSATIPEPESPPEAIDRGRRSSGEALVSRGNTASLAG